MGLSRHQGEARENHGNTFHSHRGGRNEKRRSNRPQGQRPVSWGGAHGSRTRHSTPGAQGPHPRHAPQRPRSRDMDGQRRTLQKRFCKGKSRSQDTHHRLGTPLEPSGPGLVMLWSLDPGGRSFHENSPRCTPVTLPSSTCTCTYTHTHTHTQICKRCFREQVS